LKSFADLRHTLYNLHLYSINEETRSEHWVATPILPAPRDFHPLYNPWRTSITLISCRSDYLQLSPAIQNCYNNFLLPKLNSIIFHLRHRDRATRTPTLPYSQITLTSTRTSLLVYLGLEQSPANP
jgi:hypothetical protein